MKTCQWYVSIEQPVCGKPASATVKIKTAATQASVDLCSEHKQENDVNFARIRAERKSANSSK